MATKLSKNELKAIKFVRNSIVHRGQSPSVRDLMKALGYVSPNSANFVIKKLIDSGYLKRRKGGQLQLRNYTRDFDESAATVDIPLVGAIACGTPIMAVENIEAYIPVSVRMARPPYRYFLLRAQGDSMNAKEIKSGDLILVRQQETADSGDIVVALIDDEATVKQMYVYPDAIVLKPRSKNKKHQPIILDRDFQIQGKVIATIPSQ